MEKKIPLVIIAGPTGIGKSDLAMQLALQLNTQLISADSRQIYREMNIGTAKPSAGEQLMVKHQMIDICEPTRNFTVAEYAEMVRPVIEMIYRQGKIPLMAGGTGLYIKSLIEGFSIPEVQPLPEFREKLKQEAELNGSRVLYERAIAIDPEAMAKIHENDLFRIIRVLEIYESTGKPASSLRKRAAAPVYDLFYIGLDLEREKLYERIGYRVEKMIEAGLVEEVEGLLEKYGSELPLLQTINYREIVSHLKGELSLSEAKELMKKDTRNFAKRQLTWFRNDPHITWKSIETPEDSRAIIRYVMERLEHQK